MTTDWPQGVGWSTLYLRQTTHNPPRQTLEHDPSSGSHPPRASFSRVCCCLVHTLARDPYTPRPCDRNSATWLGMVAIMAIWRLWRLWPNEYAENGSACPSVSQQFPRPPTPIEFPGWDWQSGYMTTHLIWSAFWSSALLTASQYHHPSHRERIMSGAYRYLVRPKVSIISVTLAEYLVSTTSLLHHNIVQFISLTRNFETHSALELTDPPFVDTGSIPIATDVSS